MYSDIERRSDGGDPSGDVVREKLRRLSAELRPPVGWDELGARILRARAGRSAPEPSGRWGGELERLRRGPVRWSAAAAACVGLLAVAGIVGSRHHAELHVRPTAAHVVGGTIASTDTSGRVQHSAAEASPSAMADSEAQQALARAATAEHWLANEPESPTVVHVSSRLAVVDLENGIASLDDELDAARVLDGGAVRVRKLQLERAQLVDSLAQIRYAEMLADETQ